MKFQIKKTEYVNRTYRIPKDLAERLAQVAQEEDISATGGTSICALAQCRFHSLSDLCLPENMHKSIESIQPDPPMLN